MKELMREKKCQCYKYKILKKKINEKKVFMSRISE